MNWEEYVGARILAKIGLGRYVDRYSEVIVLEVSPSGFYIKVKYANSGVIEWVHKDDIVLIEELEDKPE